MKFEPGKFYTHDKMGDVIFHVHAVGDSRVTGMWLTKNGTMLSMLSDNIRVKDHQGWQEVKFREVQAD
jgi:hypothetical protein